MKKLSLTLSMVFLSTFYSAHATNTNIRKKSDVIHETSNTMNHTLPGKCLKATVFYALAGLHCKALGSALHAVSGLPRYEYLQEEVGQCNTVRYPKLPDNLSSTKRIFAKTAHALLSLGSAAHWPLRSTRDFGLGIVAGILNPSSLVKPCTLKEWSKETLARSPFGIAAGVVGYQTAITFDKLRTNND